MVCNIFIVVVTKIGHCLLHIVLIWIHTITILNLSCFKELLYMSQYSYITYRILLFWKINVYQRITYMSYLIYVSYIIHVSYMCIIDDRYEDKDETDMYIPIRNSKIEYFPYPCLFNVGNPHKNEDGFRQYPRSQVYLSSLIFTTKF